MQNDVRTVYDAVLFTLNPTQIILIDPVHLRDKPRCGPLLYRQTILLYARCAFNKYAEERVYY